MAGEADQGDGRGLTPFGGEDEEWRKRRRKGIIFYAFNIILTTSISSQPSLKVSYSLIANEMIHVSDVDLVAGLVIEQVCERKGEAGEPGAPQETKGGWATATLNLVGQSERQLPKSLGIHDPLPIPDMHQDLRYGRVTLGEPKELLEEEMSGDLPPEQKLALITENLSEVLKPDILEDVVVKQKRPLKIYWGTATTGRPHCGYFVPIVKIAAFLRAGCNVKILLADIHGFLDNLKAPIELVQFRTEYYKYVIESLLRTVDVPIEKLEFVTGSSYQLTAKYTMDLYRLTSVVTEHDSKKAGAEVVKQVDNPTLSGLIYPLMQALDEEHLDVDAQFGGVDQRKIFILAAEQLPRVGYKERAHLMNPMVPGLAGGKMSSSEPDSKIDVLDEPEIVRRKVKKAHAVPKEVEGNGLISFVEYVLLPVSSLKRGGLGEFLVEKKDHEPLVYTNVEKLKHDYANDLLTPQILKPAVTKALLQLLEPVQQEFRSSSQWQEIEKKAYPRQEVKKKEKKPKNLGTRFPGAKNIQSEPDGHVQGEGKDETNLATSVDDALRSLDVKADGSR